MLLYVVSSVLAAVFPLGFTKTFQKYTSKKDNFGSLDWFLSAQLSKVNETGCWLLVTTRLPYPPS